MKHQICGLLALCTVGIGAAGSLAPTDASAAPTSYSIYCRGGQGATDLNFAPGGVILQKQFLHGTAAYNPANLEPGTCAWPDRAMRAAEPYRLYFPKKVRGGDQVSVRGNMQLGLWRVIRSGGKQVLAEQPTPPELTGINKLQSPNFIVELRVTSTSIAQKLRNGTPRDVKVLKVTDVGVVHQVGQSNRG